MLKKILKYITPITLIFISLILMIFCLISLFNVDTMGFSIPLVTFPSFFVGGILLIIGLVILFIVLKNKKIGFLVAILYIISIIISYNFIIYIHNDSCYKKALSEEELINQIEKAHTDDEIVNCKYDNYILKCTMKTNNNIYYTSQVGLDIEYKNIFNLKVVNSCGKLSTNDYKKALKEAINKEIENLFLKYDYNKYDITKVKGYISYSYYKRFSISADKNNIEEIVDLLFTLSSKLKNEYNISDDTLKQINYIIFYKGYPIYNSMLLYLDNYGRENLISANISTMNYIDKYKN